MSLIISFVPATPYIRPLRNYQLDLTVVILSLRPRGWTDRQITNHFNETGYLTPRGCRCIPQSVFSMRNKSEKRL